MAVNSPPASLLIYIGTPNVSISPRSFRATPTESFHSNGYTNRNLLNLSTTINKYLFPALETCSMLCRSISSTFDGESSRAGIIATRWLQARFLGLHRQEITYSLTSWATVGHRYLPVPDQQKGSRGARVSVGAVHKRQYPRYKRPRDDRLRFHSWGGVPEQIVFRRVYGQPYPLASACRRPLVAFPRRGRIERPPCAAWLTGTGHAASPLSYLS